MFKFLRLCETEGCEVVTEGVIAGAVETLEVATEVAEVATMQPCRDCNSTDRLIIVVDVDTLEAQQAENNTES